MSNLTDTRPGDGTSVGFFIPLPEELARKCPPLADDNSPPHVTFLFVGDVTPDREEDLVNAARRGFSTLRVPVRGSLGEVDYFVHPEQERRIAHLSVTFNRDLALMRYRLRESLENAGFEVKDRFPLVYRPHVTMGYLPGFEERYQGGRPTGAWDFDSIELWGASKVHTVPFGVMSREANYSLLAVVKAAQKEWASYEGVIEVDALPDRVVVVTTDWRTADSLPDDLLGWPVEKYVQKNGKAMRHANPSAMRVLAKFIKKVEDEKGGKPKYEYSPQQVAKRHKEKAEKVEKLRKSIDKLRKSVKGNLKSSDSNLKTIALAVTLMDQTYERVGNEGSASEGHFGVTGWLKKHLKFEGDKAVISYTGKSGVKQRKEILDGSTVTALKEYAKDKSSGDSLLMCEGEEGPRCVTPSEINEYLKEFGITAKDIRGFHANRVMVESLQKQRKDGPTLPHPRKERDKILKDEFQKALEETAKAVGHESSTLRSDYLVPGLEDSFMKDGTVVENFKQATKSDIQKEDEDIGGLVRQSPKKKPPRKDLRRERMRVDDPDVDTGDKGDDSDLSLNHKRVAARWILQKKRQSFSYIDDLVSGRVGCGVVEPPFTANRTTSRRVNMTKKITKKGADEVVGTLERVANLLQFDHDAMGIPQKVALDLAYRLDLVSDHVEKMASGWPESQGLQKGAPNQGFDPNEIARQESGALEHDSDESYMTDNFTEQEHSELRVKQEAGQIPGADKMASHGFNLFG
jgi:2'-5' RNA ligase/uncharacterized FlaG/YvyC family protein